MEDHNSVGYWIAGVLFTAINGALGWAGKVLHDRLSHLEEHRVAPEILAESQRRLDGEVKDLRNANHDLRNKLQTFVTREDLSRLRDDLVQRDERTRDDRLEMHKDNRASLDRLENSVASLRSDIKGDIRALHERIDGTPKKR